MMIRALTEADLPAAKIFTDRAIGANYYSVNELQEILRRSQSQGLVCSLVLVDSDEQIHGLRITYPPGMWTHGKGRGLTPDRWRVPFGNTAYFQSLFVDPALSGQGWGRALSEASLEILRKLGTRAVVCHSWKESPHDSSGRYLRKLGFEVVATHEKYWFEVDYVCTRCGRPCVCTAEEMVKYL